MIRPLSEFVKAPKELFTTGHVLEVDLFIFLPQNKTILHYRRKGEAISLEDTTSLSRIPPENLLILRTERQWILTASKERISQEIGDGNLESSAVKVTAATILKSIDAADDDPSKPSGEVAREMLAQVPKIVEEIISQFKKTPSVEAYENILRTMKSTTDPLTAHNQQVSALSVLIMLTVGGFTMDEISDAGAAGLVHDLGLTLIPQTLMERHLVGDDDFNSSERLIYMKHTDIVLEMLRSSGINVMPGLNRIIQLHHENWDGTGFKGLDGNRIFRPARVMRIADELVSLINHPRFNFGFKEALDHIAKKKGNSKLPLFDPDITKLLNDSLIGQ